MLAWLIWTRLLHDFSGIFVHVFYFNLRIWEFWILGSQEFFKIGFLRCSFEWDLKFIYWEIEKLDLKHLTIIEAGCGSWWRAQGPWSPSWVSWAAAAPGSNHPGCWGPSSPSSWSSSLWRSVLASWSTSMWALIFRRTEKLSLAMKGIWMDHLCIHETSFLLPVLVIIIILKLKFWA